MNNNRQYAVLGGTPLSGEVTIGGAKNAALALLAACILTDDEVFIDNLPDVSDIFNMCEILRGIGVNVTMADDRHSVALRANHIHSLTARTDLMRKLRASYYLMGALTGKFKEAELVMPGGCNIGNRPIDQHLKGLRALGAQMDLIDGCIHIKADRLQGTYIYLDVVSVGATVNLILASVLAEGNTVLENVAREPHVVDLVILLNKMGAKIKGAGTNVLRITGVSKLHGTSYTVIPDQIEAGTYMMAAAATGGDITLRNVIPSHLDSIYSKLADIGCNTAYQSDDTWLRVYATERLKYTNLKTMPYPGFPTDVQPQMSVVLGLSDGTSVVREGIFENRFKYASELNKMGGNFTIEGTTAIIQGVKRYKGAQIVIPDLRAGAALVIAALSADGYSALEGISYVERGYEDFVGKLNGLGAKIEKITDVKEYTRFVAKVS